MTSGDKGEAGEKGRTGDFGFPGPQVHTEYVGLLLLSHYTISMWPKKDIMIFYNLHVYMIIL